MKAESQMNPFKLSILFTMSLIFSSVVAVAGPKDSGGGDNCESRLQEIKKDLTEWIQNGGHQKLDFTQASVNVTADEYAKRMLQELKNKETQFSCVGPKDRGYPVQVNGEPKTCVWQRVNPRLNKIKCDTEKILSQYGSGDIAVEQYRVIHHEFASLAGVEVPQDAISAYGLSQQLGGMLAHEIVQKLSTNASASTQKNLLVTDLMSARSVYLKVTKPITIINTQNYETLEGAGSNVFSSCMVNVAGGSAYQFSEGIHQIRMHYSEMDVQENGSISNVKISFFTTNSPRILLHCEVKSIASYNWFKSTTYTRGAEQISELNKALKNSGWEFIAK